MGTSLAKALPALLFGDCLVGLTSAGEPAIVAEHAGWSDRNEAVMADMSRELESVVANAAPAARGIKCPGASKPECTSKSEHCCFSPSSSEGACDGASSSCEAPLVEIRCDDGADCGAGQTCCGKIAKNTAGNVFYAEVSCSSRCTPNQTYPGERRFCDPSLSGSADDECRSLGLTCSASIVLVGYFVCG